MNEKELRFIGGAKQDHLYTHHFPNGAGKYFNIVTTEDGHTVLEYEEPQQIRNRLKLTLTFINDGSRIKDVTFKKFKFYKNRGWEEQPFGGGFEPFTITHFSFQKLVEFLRLLSDLDLASVNERRIPLVEGGTGIDPDTIRRIKALLIQPEGQKVIEELIKSGLITSRDIVNIGYRKHQLEVFERLLNEPGYVAAYATQEGIRSDQPEKAWQHFLKQNDWIFGFGLDYRFLGILQAEAHMGTEDVVGRGGAVGDFLMGATNFTVLVEVKRPDTALFAGSPNRANSWQLSREIIDAVSQILAQKASWQIKSETNAIGNYDDAGKLIRQRTVDPKCLLILGSDNMFSGDDRERELKLRTFELFRRDSRNIDLITYTEMFERAKFIVHHGGSA